MLCVKLRGERWKNPSQLRQLRGSPWTISPTTKRRTPWVVSRRAQRQTWCMWYIYPAQIIGSRIQESTGPTTRRQAAQQAAENQQLSTAVSMFQIPSFGFGDG